MVDLVFLGQMGLCGGGLVFAFVMHEWGHLWVARVYGVPSRFVWDGLRPGVVYGTRGLSREVEGLILVMGPLVGLVPLVWVGVLDVVWSYGVFSWTLLLYVLGCHGDFRRLWELR